MPILSTTTSTLRAPATVAVLHRSSAKADDVAVARAAAEGHPTAAAIIWDRFSPLVRSILRRALGPSEEVQDLVQDVFLNFFKQIHGLRDPSALRCFIIGIAVRVAGSHLRRRRVRRFLHLTPTGVVPDESAAPEDDDDAREALVRLYALLDRFDDGDRLAFALRHIHGMELTDVAQALGVSLATAKRRLSRISDRLAVMVARDPLLREYVTGRESLASPMTEDS